MTAAKKRRIPANDQRPREARRVSYVVLPRKSWDGKKMAAAAVLGVFVFMLGAIQMSAFDRDAAPSKNSEPFDITLNSDAPAIQGDATEEPVYTPLSYKALPPLLEVKVEEGAEAQASIAQEFMREGEMAQAIRYQRRAVALEPANMLHRLKLAIMHDRISDREGAAILYRQVSEAYEKNDKTLPRKLDIENIRSRLAYLTSMAGK